MISEQEMTALAHACRLSLTPEEREQYARDLEALESLVCVLLEPFSITKQQREAHTLAQMREDVILPSLSREELLKSAPLQTDGYIVVPRTVGEA